MFKKIVAISLIIVGITFAAVAQGTFEKDRVKTKAGDLDISFIGHGTLMFEIKGKTIHVDPVSDAADYKKMPKADLILVTHEHGDHLNIDAIKAIYKDNTKIVSNENANKKIMVAVVLKNGDSKEVAGFKITAVPAYNIKHMRGNGKPFHPKGNGNGYVITIGDKNVYIAGDAENTPEMKALKDIDIAFLPMNLPYTMTPEMVADAAKAFKPKILYPYHYGDTDTSKLVELMKDAKGVEVRVRKM